MIKRYQHVLYTSFAILNLMLLSGCSAVVLDPKGIVGERERNLIILATLLMLIVVVPAIILTLYFAKKYRAVDKHHSYNPEWAHSTKVESVMWGLPILIILILGVITWVSTHELDPYRPLDSDKKPVRVQVVALNWKWLFIYPDQKIATVNTLTIPTDRPIAFDLTADAPMNSFMIPQLGGQIYAMSGMRTKLHLQADHVGVYDGRGVSYTGRGFSGMTFKAHAISDADFDAWVHQVRSGQQALTVKTYNRLAKDSENNPVQLFSTVYPGLFSAIMNKYMMPGMRDSENNLLISQSHRMNMSHTMHEAHDMKSSHKLMGESPKADIGH